MKKHAAKTVQRTMVLASLEIYHIPSTKGN